MRSFVVAALLMPMFAHAAGLDTLVTEYQADRRDLASSPAVDWAPAALERQEAWLADWEKRLDQLDYETLDVAARIDWHLLRTTLRESRDGIALQHARSGGIAPLLGFSPPLLDLANALAARRLAEPAKSAQTLAEAATSLKALRKKLEAGREKNAPADALKPTAVEALRAAGALDELRGSLAAWYGLYDGFQPEFGWWNRQPYEALAKELGGLREFLAKEIAGQKGDADDPLVGDPIGAEALAAALRAEMIPYSAAELLAIADKEFAWCEAEMKKAAEAMGCTSAAEALEKVKQDHVPPGGQAALAIAEAEKSIAFLKQHELVTIPPLAEQSWGISMIGPEQQKSLPYAVYSQPRIMVAFAHESMGQEEKLEAMRGNARGFLHIVTPHELIPGHHLQAFMARRHASWRAPFNTPFLVEGWALHWEMLLWDAGYIATPEEKVGALFWRMHRCARILVSLRFHLGEMTPAEMVDFLVEKVGHERSGATAEVRRYIGPAYGPLYQAAYMTGGLQIHALQRELAAPSAINPAGRGTLTLRAFHDGILRQGPIPIEMMRAALKDEKLPKDWQPAWRFAD